MGVEAEAGMREVRNDSSARASSPGETGKGMRRNLSALRLAGPPARLILGSWAPWGNLKLHSSPWCFLEKQ